jgi:lipopolysaccharide/colanic/teichoic acid biosynthesis glycosyltransferase
LDFIFAAVGIVVLGPVAIVIAVLLALALRAAPVFRQERVGLGERRFMLYKFKTMTDRRDATGALRPDAERLTTVGRWMRRTSLDELPQLWNVLRGDLSFVGPRPLLPRYLPYYSARERLRHTVRPGITGWAQIHGRNKVPWEQRLALDAWYAEHWSLGLDLKILCATVPIVLRREGAVADPKSAMNDLNDERQRWMAS